MLTTLQGFDQEGDHDMILVWDTVDLCCLGNFTTSIHKGSRKKTLTAVSLAVGDEKRVLGELCAPCDDGRDEGGVESIFWL